MPVEAAGTETRSCWESEYWLRHCEGFRVFAGDEPIGYVEELLVDEEDEAVALEVRVGEVFTHRLEIPLGGVDGVDPVRERVVLAELADLGADAFGRQLRIPTAV